MFLETICIQNGIVQNEASHKERMRQTALRFGFTAPELPVLSLQIPKELKEKKVKCSIIYHNEILNISFSNYISRKIDSLKLIEADVDYTFKYSDRSVFNALLKEKENCDEILIVRDNCITDTSFSNVVFRKNNEFFTPDSYLLNGTKRQRLLQNKKIKEMRITTENLSNFDELFLINAMLNIEDGVSLSVEKIEK